VKTALLPPNDEILTRLRAIDDIDHSETFFRLALAQTAGGPISGVGIGLILSLAFAEYTAGHMTPFVASFASSLPDYVPAFTDDPEVEADARATLKASGYGG
jgi:hypothetical protein